MAADDVFKCGRHKNKTYEEVARLDEDFCKNVLQSTQFNDFYPEAFKAYLESRKKDIKERGPQFFLEEMDQAMKTEFSNIIGRREVHCRQIHDKSTSHPNGFLGVLYRYVAKKVIFNLKNENAYCNFITNYASIFPFKVYKNVRPSNVEVRRLYDDAFKNEVQDFLRQHFDDEVSGAEVTDLFLANISRFRREHFNENSVKSLRNVVENLTGRRPGDNGDRRGAPLRTGSVNAYLKNFPRLNDKGVGRYKTLYECYKLCAQLYHDFETPCRDRNYFLYLPEINCYELFSLLDEEMFRQKRTQYVRLFQKYVFFFWNAVNNAKKPIFFIDDVLFECLKSFERYRNSRADVTELMPVLSNVSLVHRRKQVQERAQVGMFEASEMDVQNIKHYFETFPNIEKATVEYDVRTDLLEFGTFVCTDDTLLDICFSKRERKSVHDFDNAILKAAVCPRKINRLVKYNVYTGIESSMTDVLDMRNEIRNFIRKYNKCDMTVELPPEKSITWGLEKFFDERTIDWEMKHNSFRSN